MKVETADTSNKDVCTFSQRKIEIFTGNYLLVVIALLWLILLVWETFWGLKTDFSGFNIRFPIVSIRWFFPLFFVPSLFFYLLSAKFAFRILFNYKEEKVAFFLYHRKKPVVYNIRDLDIVKITWHIYFIFRNGKTIWYKGDPELFVFLREKNIPRKWGRISKILMKREYEADSTY